MPLNFTQIKTRKAGACADGGGLYLHVREEVNGPGLRFTAPDGKRAAMEFAKLGDKDGQFGLSEARDRRAPIDSRCWRRR